MLEGESGTKKVCWVTTIAIHTSVEMRMCYYGFCLWITNEQKLERCGLGNCRPIDQDNALYTSEYAVFDGDDGTVINSRSCSLTWSTIEYCFRPISAVYI
jgi:hypothetical protein